MKTLFFFIATLFTITLKSQTSIYHPFPDSSAMWNFHYLLGMCNLGGNMDSYYSITISGDTSISSQIYHKLSTPFVQSIIAGNCTPEISSGYKGAIRQDTANKKVFYVPPSDSIEQLLYDFNMQVGDTVRGHLEFGFSAGIVQSIDSVLVGNNYRKRWNINPSYSIYLIEGLGSTYGLYVPSPNGLVDLPDYSLTCFTQNGTTLYPDTNTNCQLITLIKDVLQTDDLAYIFPNPFTDYIYLENTTQKDTFKLYDSTGKLLMNNILYDKKLNFNYLENGIYFLGISHDDKCIFKKIIKL